MNKDKLRQSVGQRLRLQPVATHAGVPVDDDWLVVEATKTFIKLQHATTAIIATIGVDGVNGYFTDASRTTPTQIFGFLQLHVQVAVAANGTVDVTPLPPPRQRGGPRLTLEHFEVLNPCKLFGGAPMDISIRQMSYATICIKNDPLLATADGVAKNVTAHIVFSTHSHHHLTVDCEWDRGKEVGRLIDNFSGGGPNVWFNIGQRRSLTAAFKRVEDDKAYAVTVQPHVTHSDVEAPGLLLPVGQYRMTIEVRSHTSNVREDFVFTLVNRGQNAPLEMTPLT